MCFSVEREVTEEFRYFSAQFNMSKTHARLKIADSSQKKEDELSNEWMNEKLNWGENLILREYWSLKKWLLNAYTVVNGWRPRKMQTRSRR